MSRGWLISTCTVKVHILVFRLLFPVIPCISDRNLIIFLKFNTKLTLIKDRSFPPPQNPPLVQGSAVLDLIWLIWVTVLTKWICCLILFNLYPFLLYLFTSSACLMQGWMLSFYNSLEACRGAQLLPMLDSIPQYMDHLLIFLLSSDRY